MKEAKKNQQHTVLFHLYKILGYANLHVVTESRMVVLWGWEQRSAKGHEKNNQINQTAHLKEKPPGLPQDLSAGWN